MNWEEMQEVDKKPRKSRSKEKVMGFSSASLLPARKGEAVTQGGTMELGEQTT